MAKNSIQLNIGHNPEHHNVEEATIHYRNVSKGLVHSIVNLPIDGAEYEKFKVELIELFPEIVEYDYSRNKHTIRTRFESEDAAIYIDGNWADIYMDFYLKTEEDCHKVWQIYNKFIEEDSEVIVFMYSYFLSNGCLDDTVKICTNEELDFISKSYYPYIDTDVMFEQFFTGSENILLVVGEPGLGKSKLSTAALKYAIENSEYLPYDKMADNPNQESQYVTVAFVKSPEVLADDVFWRTLEKQAVDFCIIDDLDYMLTKRDSEVMSHDDAVKNAFLNQFLSFTDGVEKNNTKFIITTNQNFDDIDTALLRKGRLFDILELRKLKNEEALMIWKENDLKEKDFHKTFVEEYILPAELGSEINRRLNKRSTKMTQPYLKEEGISKVSRASHKKKMKL